MSKTCVVCKAKYNSIQNHTMNENTNDFICDICNFALNIMNKINQSDRYKKSRHMDNEKNCLSEK